MTTPAAGPDTELLRAMVHRVDPRDPGAFNNLGVLYHTRGLYAEAVDAFLRALDIDPRLRSAARNLEIAATQPGACDPRLAQLASRLAADSDDRVARREQARLLRLVARMDDARQALDRLIAEDPDDAAALLERALVEQRVGDLRRAQRWLERAVNAGAGAEAQLLLAEVLYQRGANEQALELVDKLLVQDATIAGAHRLRGFVLGDMGRHVEALTSAREAARLDPALETVSGDLLLHATAADSAPLLSIDPEGTLALYGLGLAFRQRGYFREARRELERARAAGEDARLVEHALAELDLVTGDAASARARYEALLSAGGSARLWTEHGVACHQAGDVAAAAHSYRRALHLDPRHVLASNNLGVALADAGDAQAATEAFERAASLDAAYTLPRLNLARLESMRGDHGAALARLRELVAFRPAEADAWHAMGTVLAQRERWAEARDAFVAAIEHRPAHAEARYALGQVLAQLGDDDGAVRETEQALGLAALRVEGRLRVGIALQEECPDAVGTLDLLRVVGGTPLAGVTVSAATLDTLLPESDAALPSHADATAPEPDAATRARALVETATAFAQRGLHGEAVDRFRDARLLLESAGTVDVAHRGLWRRAALGEARAHCLMGRAHAAQAVARQLCIDEPRDAEAGVLLAAALHAAEEQPATVQRTLRDAIARGVQSAALWHFAGDLAHAMGDDTLALDCWRQAVAADPARPSPRVAIARLLRRQGRLDVAHAELAAALEVAPMWRDALLECARLQQQAGDLIAARRALAGYAAGAPTDLEALALLADVLAAEQRDEDARVVVDRVLRHDPAHAAARFFDGVLLARRGHRRLAVQRWGQLLAVPRDEAWAARARAALDEVDTVAAFRDERESRVPGDGVTALVAQVA
ncbi:MAG: tetratricopeptide repeat protein [Gemmatimonadetes bacterium]|nr:tetratricopeptide repeat protein [Gemmatimonadota bacterium]